jgi:hypothetical protein
VATTRPPPATTGRRPRVRSTPTLKARTSSDGRSSPQRRPSSPPLRAAARGPTRLDPDMAAHGPRPVAPEIASVSPNPMCSTSTTAPCTFTTTCTATAPDAVPTFSTNRDATRRGYPDPKFLVTTTPRSPANQQVTAPPPTSATKGASQAQWGSSRRWAARDSPFGDTESRVSGTGDP